MPRQMLVTSVLVRERQEGQEFRISWGSMRPVSKERKMTWAEAMAQQGKRSPYKHDDWSSRPQHPHRNAQHLTFNLPRETVDPPRKVAGVDQLNCHAPSSSEVPCLITYVRDQRRHQTATLGLHLHMHTDVPRHV